MHRRLDAFALGWAPRDRVGASRPTEPADDSPSNLVGGTVEYFAEGKSLVVNQTAEVLMQIEELLMELRQSKREQEKK